MAAGKASGSSSILATRQALPIFQLKNDFLRAVSEAQILIVSTAPPPPLLTSAPPAFSHAARSGYWRDWQW
jgi:HrpA-like RNA helicase